MELTEELRHRCEPETEGLTEAQRDRARIKRQVDAYLADGGKVDKVDHTANANLNYKPRTKAQQKRIDAGLKPGGVN